MGPPRAFWLLLALPEVLQSQTLGPLLGFPQLQSFQGDKFQGDWFVLGLAGNSFGREHGALLSPFLTTYTRNDTGWFEVSNAMTRGKRCDTWSYTLIPATQPGQFTVGSRGPGADREDVRVVDTDYTGFALLLTLRQATRQPIIRVSLLGRSWQLPPKTLDRFACLAKSQGLKAKNVVFPDIAAWLPSPDGCGRMR